MKSASAFEKILDQVLARETSSSPSPFLGPQAPAAPNSFKTASQAKVGNTSAHFELNFENFGQGWRFNSNSAAKNAYRARAKVQEARGAAGSDPAAELDSQQAKIFSKSTLNPTPNLSPKPKPRRQFTFDQLRAAQLFCLHGAFVDAESSAEEIKSAYRKLAKSFHPDAGAKTDDTFKKISAAYKKLAF